MNVGKMRIMRMKKELKDLKENPPYGICAYLKDQSDITKLEAKIQGPRDSVYELGTFKVNVSVPQRYPIEPPHVSFRTHIYHMNIDESGRICLDILNLPPKGKWTPALNISTVLTSIQLLLAEPNPSDALMTEISDQYLNNRKVYEEKARNMTKKYATSSKINVKSVTEKSNKKVLTSDDSDSDSDSDDSDDSDEEDLKQKEKKSGSKRKRGEDDDIEKKKKKRKTE